MAKRKSTPKKSFATNKKTSKKSTPKKSSAKKSTTKKKSKSRVSLNPLRDQLKVLVDQANARANAINNQGLVSRAVQEAQRTLKKQSKRVDDNQLFRSDLKTRREINREFARVQSFLGDYTSTVTGAQNFDSELKSLTDLKGAFGGKWKATTGENYDTSRIDKTIATETFEIYRRVTEAAGGWERAVGLFQGKESLIGYGSETLITNIYNMLVNHEDEANIYNIARDMIETGVKNYADMAKKQVSDYDYGIVFDDEEAQARRNYYNWRRAYKFGKKRQNIYD